MIPLSCRHHHRSSSIIPPPPPPNLSLSIYFFEFPTSGRRFPCRDAWPKMQFNSKTNRMFLAKYAAALQRDAACPHCWHFWCTCHVRYVNGTWLFNVPFAQRHNTKISPITQHNFISIAVHGASGLVVVDISCHDYSNVCYPITI